VTSNRAIEEWYPGLRQRGRKLAFRKFLRILLA
jgi:hypothetical protein